jgi:hypothetical protein
MPSELTPAKHPGEKRRQLHLLDEHEKAGHLTAETAARYRADLLERGVSIFGRPMDGRNAAAFVKQCNETALALAQDTLRNPNVRAVDAEARRLQRRLLRGDTAAAFVRLAPSPERRATRPAARARRTRSVRTSRGKARSPGSRSSGDDPPHLEAVPLCRSRQDVRRWLEGVA